MNTSSPNARLRPFRPVPFGRYTLLSQLATGGMGEIFLARLEGVQGFEKLCVIKKILPQLAADPEFVERFVGEARTLVKLSHGSIAQVLDMGLNEGEAYMALEYVDGKDLRKVAARARDRQKPLPLTFILFVMCRVLDALAYAHRKKGDDEGELNLVHRDISPQNILISYEGEVKVIDFGLAKSRLSAAKTNPSIILGKFLYMSPEQARHQPVDRRSDLYAVGLCLYELVSGHNPFDLLPPGELMSAVASPAIKPLQEVAPFAPPLVAQLVMKALAVDPAQRFQSAEELRARLTSCLLELDPHSGPESVSRYMHELFASEYLSERRMLVTLREVGRAPEPEPVVIGMPEGAPPRPMPTLPPKTIRLDGPVEPLSFRPTPRTRDGGPAREEGETRPAVPMDEPTRPAVALEAIAESARGRAPSDSPPPMPPPPALPGAIAPTRELQVPLTPPAPAFQAPPPPPEPAVVEVPLEPVVPVPIEDTPVWSEPLQAEEEPRRAEASLPFDVPGEEEGPPPSLPFETDADLPPVAEASEPYPEEAVEVEVRLDDTQPRIQMPPPSQQQRPPPEDTQPRVSLQDVYRQNTQPRVVLDSSVAPELGAEEVSQSGRSKPGVRSTTARRRVTSTGVSSVVPRTGTASRVATGVARSEPRESPGEGVSEEVSPPPPHEITRRTAMPSRPGRPWLWLGMGLVLLVLGAGVGALLFILKHHEPPVRIPPARPLSPPGKSAQVRKAPEPEPTPAAEPTPAPVEPVPAEAAQTTDAGTAVAAAAEPVPDKASPEPTPVEHAPAAAGPAPVDPTAELLVPLDPTPSAPAPAPTKRTPPPRKRTGSHSQTLLQKEWVKTRTAYKKLTREFGCENLDFLCGRYESLEAEVRDAGDAEDFELLGKVKALQKDIAKRKSGS